MKHTCLPPTWVWTRHGKGPNRLFAARDTRWDPTVPDLVSTSAMDVRRQAHECDEAENERKRRNRPEFPKDNWASKL